MTDQTAHPRVKATFSTTELANRTGSVLEAAYEGPVALTKHGDEKFFILSKRDYQRFVEHADPRRVYRTEDTHPALREEILALMETIIAKDNT